LFFNYDFLLFIFQNKMNRSITTAASFKLFFVFVRLDIEREKNITTLKRNQKYF